MTAGPSFCSAPRRLAVASAYALALCCVCGKWAATTASSAPAAAARRVKVAAAKLRPAARQPTIGVLASSHVALS